MAKKVLKASISGKSYERLLELANEIPEPEALKILEKMFGRAQAMAAFRAMHDGSFPSVLQVFRRQLRFRNWMKRPDLLIRYVVQNLFRLIGRWLRPTGLLIAVLGPDGVGKDTLLAAISKQWSVPFRFHRYFHWRPGFIRKLKNFGKPTPEPHKNLPKDAIASVVALGSYVLDYWYASLPLMAFRARSGLVIFNRYFHDLLVDPRRYRYSGPMWLVRMCSHLIPPRERLVLVLDADEATILSRKMELSMDELTRQRGEYRRLLQYDGFVHVAADDTIEEVLERVNRLIMNFLSQRFKSRYRQFSPLAVQK